MEALVKLIKLLYPFLQEFGLKEVNIKQFIIKNKTLSYLLCMCFLLFMMFLYAIEQAHLRMLNRPIFLEKQEELQIIIAQRDSQIEQLEMICEQTAVNDGTTTEDVNSVLSELMGTTNEK